ncbi:hypothetical protein L1987_01436 [Smallanthus sonchifolius]|uniref:Uncharacterized protein n=1 Tax=Smallanthus sonchifolius TaxID=185202 RepID=A0ACB9K554_9ASTR|nr:hypothetical protein L1987_01436 [Smallanthus sonchifolius]
MNLAEYSFHMAMLINTGKSDTEDRKVNTTILADINFDANFIVLKKQVTYRPVAENDNDHHALRSSELDPLRRQIIALFQCILCFANFYELSLMYSAILFIKLI